MISVNFIFKNCASALSLSFKAFKNADDLRRKATSLLGTTGNFECCDDYDQVASVDMGTVAAVSMGDIEKDLDRQGELGILQSKAQMRAQVSANNDKGLSMLANAVRPQPQPSLIKSN